MKTKGEGIPLALGMPGGRESQAFEGDSQQLSICSGDVGPLLIDLIFDTQI